MKICNRCKIDKPNDTFALTKRKDRNGKIYYSINWICKSCSRDKGREYRANQSTRSKQKERALERKRNALNPVKTMYNRCQKRALSKGIEFTIKESDIIWNETCPLLGISLKLNTGKAGDNSPSLDRIDSTKGYIPGNICVISRLANIMKAHATIEQIFTYMKNMQFYLDQYKIREFGESPEVGNTEPSLASDSFEGVTTRSESLADNKSSKSAGH